MLQILPVLTFAFAGLIHIILAPMHYDHAPAHGIFFAVAGVAEILWAAAFWRRPSTRMVYAGVGLAGGLLVLWVITRFLIAPFEHEPGMVDLGGLVCKASELGGIIALGALAVQGQIAGMPRSSLARTAGIALVLSLAVGAVSYGVGLALEPLLPSLSGSGQHEVAAGGSHAAHPGETGSAAARLGDLEIIDPWAGVSSKGSTGGVFLAIRNQGHHADEFVSAQTPLAAAVEIHQTIQEGDIAKMQRVEGGLEVPAGGELVLEHGSYHIMLVDLQQDLEAGDHFDLTLNFEHSGSVVVEVEVRPH